MYEAKITVHLKTGVSDPEGVNTLKALHLLGYEHVKEAETIRVYDLKIEGKTKKAVETDVNEMCKRLLTNPVIHEYTVDIKKL